MSDQLLIAILILSPVAGFIINGLLRNRLSYLIAGTIATLCVAISFCCSLTLWSHLLNFPPESRQIVANFFNWIHVGSLNVPAEFVVDPISIIMLLVITGVGSLIHLFSVGYMSHDATPAKYFCYLNLFIFNMLLLVLGSSIPVMFVGWEGVGLCSYLLIGYWFKDSEKAAAGMKAFIANRVGDAGLLLGMFLLFSKFGTLNFQNLQTLAAHLSTENYMGPLTAACLLLFLGATGKSAQIPLYVWLPDAMAGPTPVSALIHAATMVTAGVYMIVRMNAVFLISPIAMGVIAVIGALTAVMAATIGLAQWDIKKVLAYSTVSQLGFMFLACGVGAFNAAMFHLMTHAFFKALMFLGSGSVIHAMHEEQDIRKMGGLASKLPITHATFFCGWLAIIGTPLFSGFFSKDEILWMAFHSPRGHWALWAMGVVGAACTAFYMTRLMALTFWGKSRVPASVHPHESPLVMTLPLMVLAVLAVFGGYLGVPHVIGHLVHVPNVLEHWLEGRVLLLPGMEGGSAVIEWALMGISVAIAAISALTAYRFYVLEPEMPTKIAGFFGSFYKLVADKYRVDELYFSKIIDPLVELGKGLWVYIDVNLIDKLTYWITDFTQSAGDGFRSLQNGNLQQYALYIVLGLVVITTFLFL